MDKLDAEHVLLESDLEYISIRLRNNATRSNFSRKLNCLQARHHLRVESINQKMKNTGAWHMDHGRRNPSNRGTCLVAGAIDVDLQEIFRWLSPMI